MNLLNMAADNIALRIWDSGVRDGEGLRYPATLSIWARWVFLAACLIETNYRIEYGALSHILNTLYLLGVMVPGAWVLWKIRATGRVDRRWLLLLSAIDAACITFSLSLSGGFDSRYFPLYYFAVALFAWVFTSPWLVLSWTAMVAAVYLTACLLVGGGVDLGQQEEKVLFYRALVLFWVAVSVNLVTRFERVRRLLAVERERELNRQRTEMSQTIHDTTAQSAYILGLGLEDAVERAERSDPELAGKLEALWALSRSTMWALRRPIDVGRIFSGGQLSEVLTAHVDTFTVITSIPAELEQRGVEPPLSTITRSLLFSIAHNALTNAFRHSGADRVAISLEFGADWLRMSVSDDGAGLPGDYASRGHGFRNMRADAERLGGSLEVESGGCGTTVSCIVPHSGDEGGP